MTEPSEYERLVGRHVRSVLAAESRVHRYADDSGVHSIFVASAADVPTSGVTTYGTIGSSNVPQTINEQRVFVELIGACRSSIHDFGNVIASCAFESQKNGLSLVYGACIENVLDQYAASKSLRHATLVAPFLWPGLEAIEIGGRLVHWLMVVPISDGERVALQTRGIASLEAAFEHAQIDIFDIERPSIF